MSALTPAVDRYARVAPWLCPRCRRETPWLVCGCGTRRGDVVCMFGAFELGSACSEPAGLRTPFCIAHAPRRSGRLARVSASSSDASRSGGPA